MDLRTKEKSINSGYFSLNLGVEQIENWCVGEVPEGGWKSLTCRGFFLTVGSKIMIAHSHQGPSCKAVPRWGIWDGQCLKTWTKIKRCTNTGDIWLCFFKHRKVLKHFKRSKRVFRLFKCHFYFIYLALNGKTFMCMLLKYQILIKLWERHQHNLFIWLAFLYS